MPFVLSCGRAGERQEQKVSEGERGREREETGFSLSPLLALAHLPASRSPRFAAAPTRCPDCPRDLLFPVRYAQYETKRDEPRTRQRCEARRGGLPEDHERGAAVVHARRRLRAMAEKDVLADRQHDVMLLFSRSPPPPHLSPRLLLMPAEVAGLVKPADGSPTSLDTHLRRVRTVRYSPEHAYTRMSAADDSRSIGRRRPRPMQCRLSPPSPLLSF